MRLIEVLCEDQITFSEDQIPKWVKNGLGREMKFRGVVTSLYSSSFTHIETVGYLGAIWLLAI